MRQSDELDFFAFAGAANILGINRAAHTELPRGSLSPGLRSAMIAMRSENIPFTQTMHSSPASSGFSTAASMPPEPEAEIGNVMRFCV